MHIYILKSQSYNETYVGITNNLVRRLKEHNAGKNTYTKRHIPWKVIYKEEVESIMDARKKEKYFKSSAGRRWMKKNLF